VVICKGCQQAIAGAYVTALGATWHAAHFCCAACHRPIGNGSFAEHQGAPYHPDCYRLQVAPRCAYCHKPLVGSYLVDHWGTKFCHEHTGTYPACRFCGRLVPPQHDAQVGRGASVRCPICRASAIEQIAQAQPLFTRLVQWLNYQNLQYHNLNLRIELRNRTQLAEFLRHPGDTQALGAALSTTYTQNGHVLRTTPDGVAILRGLPTTLFQGVTIHELGHVWLAVHQVTGLPPWAEEGFCEFLAYHFWSQMNTAESRYHAENTERNPDPVYGAGFRRVAAVAQHTGFQRLITTLRTAKELPFAP